MRLKPRLVVFDWDGTLADSTRTIVDCLARAIEQNGLPALSEQRLGEVIGLALPEAMCHLLPEVDEAVRTRVAEAYRHEFFARTTPTRLFDGARETIEALHGCGIWMGVATGKSRRGLMRSLDETGLARFLPFQRTADDCPSKPHPAMLEEIAAEAGLAPDELLMVGDTDYDLMMARHAGVPAFAVTHGGHDRRRLEACGPVACLDRLPDLLDWIEE